MKEERRSEVREDVGDLNESFCAFVDGTNFCFAGATGSVSLAFRGPVERTAEPDDVACNILVLE